MTEISASFEAPWMRRAARWRENAVSFICFRPRRTLSTGQRELNTINVRSTPIDVISLIISGFCNCMFELHMHSRNTPSDDCCICLCPFDQVIKRQCALSVFLDVPAYTHICILVRGGEGDKTAHSQYTDGAAWAGRKFLQDNMWPLLPCALRE